MATTKAFVFDLNGTMIDDMEYHIRAWSHILNNELGAHLNYEEVKYQMYGKNTELLKRVFGASRFTVEEMNKISIGKEKRYQKEFFPHLRLLEGLPDFLHDASNKNFLMAIGSAAIPFNIDFVLDNLNIRHYFKAIISADDVVYSKPDPETFIKAAGLLGVEPSCCTVFEDAPKGVECALRAGMKCVVLTTMHAKEDFSSYPNVIAFIEDYTNPFCMNLLTSANG